MRRRGMVPQTTFPGFNMLCRSSRRKVVRFNVGPQAMPKYCCSGNVQRLIFCVAASLMVLQPSCTCCEESGAGVHGTLAT